MLLSLQVLIRLQLAADLPAFHEITLWFGNSQIYAPLHNKKPPVNIFARRKSML